MTRGSIDTAKKNYLKAKLENFGKGNEQPTFVIRQWNGVEEEEVGKGMFIEGQLKKVSTKDTNFGKYCTIELVDKEGNAIQWGMKLGKTMQNIIYKMYAPASKDITIGNVMFKTGMFNDKKYVSLFIDGQKWDNPFTEIQSDGSYKLSKDITDKVREIKDPETGEVVKRDDTKLVEWIENLLIPTINADLKKDGDDFWAMGTETKVNGTPVSQSNVADKIKEKNDKDLTDYSDLPF